MSERDEFEARVDDLVARSFVVTDGPRHPFSKGGETWAERDAVVRVVLADVASRAPQAVPALTDKRRRAAAKAMVEIFLGCPPHREPGQLDLQAVDAVARIILSAPQPSTEPKKPEHAHDWRFSLQDHVYKCDCGATRGDYPFGAASFKD